MHTAAPGMTEKLGARQEGTPIGLEIQPRPHLLSEEAVVTVIGHTDQPRGAVGPGGGFPMS